MATASACRDPHPLSIAWPRTQLNVLRAVILLEVLLGVLLG
jgi:hypothetical protein